VRTIGHPVVADGRVVRVRESLQDITARACAEIERAERLERYRRQLQALTAANASEALPNEHLDGSGYPRGLKGEAIILEARVLAVADVVEAMSSHRPYRPAHDIGAALAEIEEHRGTWYDPAVVDACVRLFRERGFQLG
jgi:response regulator RpfG family c-di-GMP phosphodiesterase